MNLPAHAPVAVFGLLSATLSLAETPALPAAKEWLASTHATKPGRAGKTFPR